MTLVAILTVRRAAVETFRTFERRAAAVMMKHGGRMERTVVVDGDSASEVFKEVHIVTFPSEHALAAYRSDAELRELGSLRESAVVHTDLLVGQDGPSYHPL
jgi:uncharacterized protein (DUF1330 family)